MSDAFRGIGDYPRPGWLEDLAYLLERGIKVALVYGDRDYACNWIGGEDLSLAIDYVYTSEFHSAGYEPISVSLNASDADPYIGGLVRQYGNLSYSRVFQAGHEVPSWQPETALAIFERALGNRDIATGTKNASSALDQGQQYSSVGPSDTWWSKNAVPEQELWFCYTLVPGTCTEAQLEAVQNGSVRISRYIVEDANSTKLFPELFEKGEALLDLSKDLQGHSDTTQPEAIVEPIRAGKLQLVLSE